MLLLGGAVWMYARVWVSGHPSGTVICQCGDPGQAVWFMAWVPYAIAHLHDPLFTTRMLAGQGGANLLESTSYLLPSFLLSPVTWLFGATASFNVAETLGPVISGWAMYVAAGRLSSRWLVRAVAAVSYGFCPFLVGSVAYGHLNFVWLYFPPLLFFACHEIFAGRRSRPWSVGLLLGLLVVAQFFTGTEPLLITVVAASLGLLVAVAVAPRAAWERRRRILVALAVAGGVALVLLAYPLWYLTHGPRRIVGVPWPGDSLFGLPLRATVLPPTGEHVGSGFLQIGGYFGPAGPTGSYLGIWLLVFLGISLPLIAVLRRRAAWPLLAAGALAWLCSLGANLMPSLGSSPWWLPWRYLHTWPYLQEIGPPRFALVVAAAAALLLALSLDSWVEVLLRGVGRLRREAPRPGGLAVRPRRLVGWRPRRLAVMSAGASAFVLAVAIAVGLPLAEQYTFPLTMHSDGFPAWFATTARHLPPATRVLTYPYASSGVSDAMYWQAADGLGFALVGGRAMIPGADGRHSAHVDPLGGSIGLLMDDSFGFGLGSPPPLTVAQADAMRASLKRWQVDVVVVVDLGRAPAWAVTAFSEVLGRLPAMQHGAAVYVVDKETDRPVMLTSAAFNRCATRPLLVHGLAAPRACLAASGAFGG